MISKDMKHITENTKKLNWIESQLEQFKESKREIITFIADILYHGEDNDSIRKLFTAGYCYYFAKILEDAFGGEVCWHKEYSHIVWRDENGCCYDIEGVFYDYEDDTIVPVSVLEDKLEFFRHRKPNA